MKTLRNDNGGEYTSNEFEFYLKKEGIRHKLTILKIPEQNGVTERLNRTLVETSRSMLIDSKLPKRFWVDAVSTAMYLKNRSPSRPLQDMTPYEAWHGNKPSVSHLRVFGCDAYAHIPQDERSKFDSMARKCILTGKSESAIKRVKDDLSRKFDTKDLGKLSYFLGMKIELNKDDGSVWIGQRAYTESILKKFGMEECKPISTPVDVSSKLTCATENDDCIDQQRYQSAIGSLMYLSVSTRPDISYAVSSLARFSSKPSKEHWTTLKRLLRYLKGSTEIPKRLY